MTIDEAIGIADRHRTARRRLTEIVLDTESGVEDEIRLKRNEAAFRHYALLPDASSTVPPSLLEVDPR